MKKKWKKILEVKTQIYEIESEFTQLNKRCLKSDFGIDSSVKKKLKVNNSKDIFSMSTKKGTVYSNLLNRKVQEIKGKKTFRNQLSRFFVNGS